jgi:uncharacterized membrane protein
MILRQATLCEFSENAWKILNKIMIIIIVVIIIIIIMTDKTKDERLMNHPE